MAAGLAGLSAEAGARPGASGPTEFGDPPGEPESLLVEQSELVGRLERLGVQQSHRVRGEGLHRLPAILAERRTLLERLRQVQSALLDATDRGELTVENKVEVDRTARDHETRLRRLAANAADDARVVAIKRNAVAEGLGAAHAAQRAIDAYGAVRASDGRVDLIDGGQA